MQHEKATDTEDLPHRFEAVDGRCSVCHGNELDARHVAWQRERAAQQAPPPVFERELGT